MLRHGCLALFCTSLVACNARGLPTTGPDPATNTAGTTTHDPPRTTQESCFDAWADPSVIVSAPARPSPASPAMRLEVSYGVEAGGGRLDLDDIRPSQIVGHGDGPFDASANSGSWVELRDAAEQVLYTRGVWQLVPELVEAVGDDGKFMIGVSCPGEGRVLLTDFPNLTSARWLVFFQEALDGKMTNQTIELARFALPPQS
jgi:hypothetical protein